MGDEIAPLDNRPWIPRPIPRWLIKELNRRRNDTGISYVNGMKSGWDASGEWNQYKGPMTPWVRFCSNGDGKSKFLKSLKGSKNAYDGFVLYGGNGANDTFGLTKNKTILGYETVGEPHIIPMDGGGLNYTISTSGNENSTVPVHLPSPGIVSVDALLQKQLIRSATIKWKCYGYAQLEYLTPYFLTPGITAILEFGWNHFNPKSLLNLSKYETSMFKVLNEADEEVTYMYKADENSLETPNMGLRELWQDGTPLYASNVRISNGMYDIIYGIIDKFEYSTTDGITWDCSTTVSSKHRNFGGVGIQNKNTIEKTDENQKTIEKKQAMTFYEFVEKRLKKIKECVILDKNFFDDLDQNETQLLGDTQFLKNTFYGGKPEDRVFFSRESVYWNKNQMPKDNDWDANDTDSVWVTMGFLIELFNIFITRSSSINSSATKNFKFYEMKSDGKTIIGGHPNLISKDGTILLIPNANAPKYNNGTDYKKNISLSGSKQKSKQEEKDGYDDQVFDKDEELYSEVFKDLTYIQNNKEDLFYYANNVLWQTFKTGKSSGGGNGTWGVARDNLASIINAYRIGGDFNEAEHSFPRYIEDKDVGAIAGYHGYLEDLFVNVNHLISIVKESNTTGDLYKKLLSSLNNAVGGFWDLEVVEGPITLAIVDKKFRPRFSKPVYQFDILSSRNIIKSINFTSTISNMQANQIIASSANNRKKVSEESTSVPLDFIYGDRLFETTNSNNIDQPIIENNTVIKQLQTNSKNPSQFTMTFVNGNKKNKVNLVLPNEGLLIALLNDNDNEKNTNLYGGQQPNFTLELTLQGISGFQTFQCFSVKNFPRPYSDKEVIFQITDIAHTLTRDNWETKIKAGVRPFRTVGEQIYTDGSEII